jgi:hypothetical protein
MSASASFRTALFQRACEAASRYSSPKLAFTARMLAPLDV